MMNMMTTTKSSWGGRSNFFVLNWGILFASTTTDALSPFAQAAASASSADAETISNGQCTATTATGNSRTAVDDGDNNNIGWNPKDDHPCTIERLSMKEFESKFESVGGLLPPLFPYPLVIATSKDDDDHRQGRNQPFRDMTRVDTILESFPPNYTVTLSSSNTFSEHRRSIPLVQYLREVGTLETTPDQKSNETWYLFGETYAEEWTQLLRQYTLPPCQACSRHERSGVALAFGIGNSGSGVQWHVHGPGFSEAIHGRKHWILLPHDQPPEFHPDQTSYNWMYYNYSSYLMMVDGDCGDANMTNVMPQLLECTLYPGDMVYLWWHATINLDDYTAFISTFTQEHLFLERMGKKNKNKEMLGSVAGG